MNNNQIKSNQINLGRLVANVLVEVNLSVETTTRENIKQTTHKQQLREERREREKRETLIREERSAIYYYEREDN